MPLLKFHWFLILQLLCCVEEQIRSITLTETQAHISLYSVNVGKELASFPLCLGRQKKARYYPKAVYTISFNYIANGSLTQEVKSSVQEHTVNRGTKSRKHKSNADRLD